MRFRIILTGRRWGKRAVLKVENGVCQRCRWSSTMLIGGLCDHCRAEDRKLPNPDQTDPYAEAHGLEEDYPS